MKRILALITALVLCMTFAVSSSAAQEDGSGSSSDSGFTLPEITAPNFSIRQSSVPTIEAGQSGTVAFSIENTTFSYVNDISVQYSSDNAAIKIAPEDSIVSGLSVSAFKKKDLTVPVTVAPNASGTYSISVTVSYKYSTDLFTQNTGSFSGTVSFFVNGGDRVRQPIISDMKFVQTEVLPGEMNTLGFTVTNPNEFPLYNVEMTIDGFMDGYIDNLYPDDLPYAEKIEGGDSVTFTVKAVTTENISAQIYNFSVSLTASDSFGNTYSATKGTYFTVKAEEKEEEKKYDEFNEYSPRLIIDSYSMKPTSAQPGNTVTLELSILNIGIFDAENVKISLGGYDSSYITLREVTPQKVIAKIRNGETAKVQYSMTLSSVFPQDTNVPLTVSFIYNDEFYGDLTVGKSYSDSAIINIMSVSPKAKEEQQKPEWVAPVYKTPKVIIENFDAGNEFINAGEEFTLTFTLKNTSSELDVENIKVLLSSAPGTSGSSDVFTPVNSGYSFYIDKIGKLDTYTLSIPLLAKVSAESGIYAVNFNISYEYYEETSETTGRYISNNDVETVSMKVVQPINIEISNFYAEYFIPQGQTGYISFSYNNKSRSNLYFLNIDIEGDVQFSEGKQEIGSIPSGYSDYFDGMIVANGEPGEKQCNLVFTFKDSLNKESQIKYPFTITISEPYTYEEPAWSEEGGYEEYYGDDTGYEEPAEEGMKILGFDAWIVFTAAGVLAACIIVIVIVVCVKKKKKDEDEE